MTRATLTEVPWDHDGLDLLVVCEVEPGSPGGWEEAPEGPGVEVLEVTEEETGKDRPDLVAAAQASEAVAMRAIEYVEEESFSRWEDAAESRGEA